MRQAGRYLPGIALEILYLPPELWCLSCIGSRWKRIQESSWIPWILRSVSNARTCDIGNPSTDWTLRRPSGCCNYLQWYPCHPTSNGDGGSDESGPAFSWTTHHTWRCQEIITCGWRQQGVRLCLRSYHPNKEGTQRSSSFDRFLWCSMDTFCVHDWRGRQ